MNPSAVALARSLTTRTTNGVACSLACLAVAMSLVLGPSDAHAWGGQGHQVVAGLALVQLTPKATSHMIGEAEQR